MAPSRRRSAGGKNNNEIQGLALEKAEEAGDCLDRSLSSCKHEVHQSCTEMQRCGEAGVVIAKAADQGAGLMLLGYSSSSFSFYHLLLLSFIHVSAQMKALPAAALGPDKKKKTLVILLLHRSQQEPGRHDKLATFGSKTELVRTGRRPTQAY